MQESTLEAIKRYYYRVIVTSKDKTKVKAIVSLYGEKGPLATVYFCETASLPPAKKRAGQYELFYRYFDFPVVLDMLRNEKQTYLVWQGPEDSLLSTSPEPLAKPA